MLKPPKPDDYIKSYRRLVKNLLNRHHRAKAMAAAVGGQFEAFGILSRQILTGAGLKDSDYLVDVGCGSGRLSHVLNVERYLGTDVVPDLLRHARSLRARPHWRFELVEDIIIPERREVVDMVCFFSVFTHLLHEDSFRYLREAERVLKHGGKVAFTFLDFRVPSHWPIFESAVGARERLDYKEHTQFISPDMIRAWADHMQLNVEAIYDGNVPYVVAPYPLILDDGTAITGATSLGQSVCILKKE
jgi:SAM-dependent methyltransferase